MHPTAAYVCRNCVGARFQKRVFVSPISFLNLLDLLNFLFCLKIAAQHFLFMFPKYRKNVGLFYLNFLKFSLEQFRSSFPTMFYTD